MKKIIILILLLLSIVVVCPLPIDMNTVYAPILDYLFSDGARNTLSNYYSQINLGMISYSGMNIVFYIIILTLLTHYFKEQVLKESYIVVFIVSYILLLIMILNFPQLMMSFDNINSIKIIFFIFFLLLMTLVTVTFVLLVLDSFDTNYRVPIVAATIVVYFIQTMYLIGSYLYHGGQRDFQEGTNNYYNFLQGINLLSIIAITVLKIFFILEIMKQTTYLGLKEHQ